MGKKLNNKGMTLIEIIITLTILGIVVAPLMSMFITSQKVNQESEMKYNAIQLAQKYMEDIKSDNNLDVSSGSGYSGTGGNYTKTIPNDGGYRLMIDINENDVVELEDVDAVIVPETFDQTVNVDAGGAVEVNAYKNDENIRINLLGGGGKIKVNDGFTGVRLYIFKSDTSYDYSISGSATVAEVSDSMDKPDNILFYITIEVYKGDRLIETVKGSKVFNSIITD